MYCYKNYWWKIALDFHLVGFQKLYFERKQVAIIILTIELGLRDCGGIV